MKLLMSARYSHVLSLLVLAITAVPGGASAGVTGSPSQVTQGNRLKLLPTGAEVLAERLKVIREARSTLFLSTYAFKTDATSRQVAAELCNAAQRGVDVRMLLDDFGSMDFKRNLLSGMRRCGVKAVLDGSTHDRMRGLVYAIHEKLLIADGKVVLIGGTGYSDYYHSGSRDSEEWHDLDARMDGPVACRFHRLFAGHWVQSLRGSAAPRGSDFAADLIRAGQAARRMGGFSVPDCQEVQAGSSQVEALHNNPWFSDARPLLDRLVKAVAEARSEVLLYAPYFVPEPRLMDALLDARKRGVEVTLMSNSPESNDEMKLIPIATFRKVGPLLDAGVKIRLWARESTLHRKGGIFDGRLAYVGSDNLDLRGQRYSSESVAYTTDPDFSAAMRNEFQLDLPHTFELTREFAERDLRGRTFLERFGTTLIEGFL